MTPTACCRRNSAYCRPNIDNAHRQRVVDNFFPGRSFGTIFRNNLHLPALRSHVALAEIARRRAIDFIATRE